MKEYKVIRKISEIAKYSKRSIQLNVMQWSNMQPKYDLRKWEDGEPKKGIALGDREARNLLIALADEFNCKIDSNFRKEVEELNNNPSNDEDDPLIRDQISFDDI